MPQKHSRITEKGRCFWYTERLWKLSEGLPVRKVKIEEIAAFDINCWFSDAAPLHAVQSLFMRRRLWR